MGEFLSEPTPSAQFLPAFPRAFHWYPLETALHSFNSPSKKKKGEKKGKGSERQ